ncbi:hypothetical protein [Brevundimonas sp. 'scallop']|uniref:hypothetical protein n=1 Tax=Brevundimonas sp. 'scallop' TaxID=2562582 RepID=UPI0013E1C0E2|nr:hypothetical protein [Brevundimonas sp. 'scallop']QIF81500.1 hypothetical protein E4341_07145 [Brevundimonas sp. 'scallop']
MIETVKTPRHLWLVGVLSLLWNGFGAFDFIQTTTRGEAYMRAAGFDDAMVAYYEAMPGWMYLPWTLGVWGAVIGSVLLLLRRRWAVPAFGLSLLGALISLIYGKLIDPPPPAPPELAAMSWMPIVILLIAVLLFGYAFNMRKRGVLR